VPVQISALRQEKFKRQQKKITLSGKFVETISVMPMTIRMNWWSVATEWLEWEDYVGPDLHTGPFVDLD
jgi:hypothetical protein